MFGSASEEAGGGSNNLIWVALGFLSFFCFTLSGGFGEKESLGYLTTSDQPPAYGRRRSQQRSKLARLGAASYVA